MAGQARIQEFHASLTFPVERGQSWLVRGIGGEPSERWTVLWATQTKTQTIFSCRIAELPAGAAQ